MKEQPSHKKACGVTGIAVLVFFGFFFRPVLGRCETTTEEKAAVRAMASVGKHGPTDRKSVLVLLKSGADQERIRKAAKNRDGIIKGTSKNWFF